MGAGAAQASPLGLYLCTVNGASQVYASGGVTLAHIALE